MELAPGLHRLEAPLGDRYTCLYLLRGEGATILFDTGIESSPRDHLLPYLHLIGCNPDEIRYVVSSHADFDHFGGNAEVLRLAPLAKFVCHRQDRPLIEDVERLIAERYQEFSDYGGFGLSDDEAEEVRRSTGAVPMHLVVDGWLSLKVCEEWSVRVTHTPGHSSGHLSIFDSLHQTALISDAVLWSSVNRADGTAAFAPTYRHVDEYLTSIEAIARWQPQMLLTGHFPVMRGTEVVQGFLEESRAFVERVETKLRSELDKSRNWLSMRELVESLAPQLGDWDEAGRSALVYPLTGHLERLARQGLVLAGRRESQVCWKWA